MWTSNKCIAVREIVTDWMKQNAVNRHWTVHDNLTTERRITLSVVGVQEPLELPNDEQIGPALKRAVEDWLVKECKS
jgi:glycyl-tRNA synthetase beta subunit